MTWPIALCLTIGGVLVGRLWSDVANAYKYAHADRHEQMHMSAQAHLRNLLPAWLIAVIITMGAVTVVIGAAQAWQYHQLTCYNKSIKERQDAAVELNRKRFEYDKTVPALLKPGNNEADVAATIAALGKYITAAQDYFEAVDKSNEPGASGKLC